MAKVAMEACVREVDAWMTANMFKMNRDKTELLVLIARHRPLPPLTSITVCDEEIDLSSKARNIGVIFDTSMSMENHIAAMCKSAFYHLRNISRIRKYLRAVCCKNRLRVCKIEKSDFLKICQNKGFGELALKI